MFTCAYNIVDFARAYSQQNRNGSKKKWRFGSFRRKIAFEIQEVAKNNLASTIIAYKLDKGKKMVKLMRNWCDLLFLSLFSSSKRENSSTWNYKTIHHIVYLWQSRDQTITHTHARTHTWANAQNQTRTSTQNMSNAHKPSKIHAAKRHCNHRALICMYILCAQCIYIYSRDAFIITI